MRRRLFSESIFLISLFTAVVTRADIPAGWAFEQGIKSGESGLIKFKLPLETETACQLSLKDLRIWDGNGSEIPYLLEEPRPRPAVTVSPVEQKMSLVNGKSVMVIKTGTAENLEGLLLQTPDNDFIKSVRVEASLDGQTWTTKVSNHPIFIKNQVRGLRIPLPMSSYAYLKITVDDKNGPPIPLTQILLQVASKDAVTRETFELAVNQTVLEGNNSRHELELPGRNLFLDSLEVKTDDSVFARKVLVFSAASDDAVSQETYLGEGSIFRVNPKGSESHSDLKVRIGQRVPGDKLVIRISNGNNPPLKISEVAVHITPTYVIVSNPAPSALTLGSGNELAPMPQYDLTALRERLADVKLVTALAGPINSNPNYDPTAALPKMNETAGAIDVSNWAYRKPIHVKTKGIYHVAMDGDVVSRMNMTGSDLRLLKDSQQIPYIYQSIGKLRALSPEAEQMESSDKNKTTAWRLRLSHKNLPLTHLTCEAADPLFNRHVTLYEEILDDRGQTQRRVLVTGPWVRSFSEANAPLSLALHPLQVSHPPRPIRSDTLILEIENGDNLPLNLSNFQLHYNAPSIVFKAESEESLWLYYGNKKASRPQYDIAMVAPQFLAAQKKVGAMGDEETLKAAQWWEFPSTSGPMKIIFWIFLAAVAVTLLVVIVKLLPAQEIQ